MPPRTFFGNKRLPPRLAKPSKSHLFKKKHRKHGPFSATERAAVQAVVQVAPAHLPTKQQIVSLAKAINRPEGSVTAHITRARETFQANATRYVEIHKEAAELALKDGSDKALDVARKASEFAMQHASAKDKSGKVERIIESQQTADVPRVQIGLVLGGMPTARPAEIIDAE